MSKHRDDDLREAFQGLRADTERGGGAPQFGAMLEAARQQAESSPALEVVSGGARQEPVPASRKLMRAGAWTSALLAASVAGLMLFGRGPSGDEEFERLVAAYTSGAAAVASASPTSRLLEVPGMDLLRSLPSIGAPVRGLDPAELPARQSSPEEENL